MFKNVLLIIHVCVVPFVTGQVDKLESECHILQTLDDLQTRLTSTEARTETEITNLKDAMTSAETRINQHSTEIVILREALSAAEGLANGTDCPDAWTAFQGSCYLSHTVAYNFQDAEAACQGLGGRLVHIETSEENTFIKSFISALKADYHWIGLEDGVIEGLWKWHGTETTATYTDWGPDEPNGGTGENCVKFSSADYWADVPCTHKSPPLCERR